MQNVERGQRETSRLTPQHSFVEIVIKREEKDNKIVAFSDKTLLPNK